MATIKKIKKYQNSGKPIKATSDSSGYYGNLSDKKYSEGRSFVGKDNAKAAKLFTEGTSAYSSKLRQANKGKPGYDANGFPIKKNKTGGVTKAKDGKWIQKATASIKKRGTAGKCTPITKPGCTGRAKALAKTFKKMAKKK
jgi:hypothetical protein